MLKNEKTNSNLCFFIPNTYWKFNIYSQRILYQIVRWTNLILMVGSLVQKCNCKLIYYVSKCTFLSERIIVSFWWKSNKLLKLSRYILTLFPYKMWTFSIIGISNIINLKNSMNRRKDKRPKFYPEIAPLPTEVPVGESKLQFVRSNVQVFYVFILLKFK